MEFSYNYTDTMSRFARSSSHIPGASTANTQDLTGCPVEMHFKVSVSGGEIPIMAFHDAADVMQLLIRNNTPDTEFVEVIVPLTLDGGNKQCSGADTILKYFTRRFGRLTKVTTPKGEIYYGGNGLVLDRNFNPIIYVTKNLKPELTNQITTIHLAPSVFIDDVSVLNKSLLRRGIAYYLTHEVGDWDDQHQANIVIDDGKLIFKKPNRPVPTVDINQEVKKLLRENIAEVLEQIKYDSRFV